MCVQNEVHERRDYAISAHGVVHDRREYTMSCVYKMKFMRGDNKLYMCAQGVAQRIRYKVQYMRGDTTL